MGAARIDGRIPNFYMLDNPVLIDHKCRPVGKTLLFIQDAVLFGNRTLEVTEEGEPEPLLLRKRSVRRRAVNADAQDLCVALLEFGDISLIRLQLLRSPPSESQNVKCQDHVFLPEIVAELYVLPIRVFEGEVGRLVTYLERVGMRRPWEAQSKQEYGRSDVQSVQH